MKLLIVESPGKVQKLTEILGDDWKVAASRGHIRDLPEKDIGVEPPSFRPQYVLTDSGKGVVPRLQRLIESAQTVYLATDPDREGESIAWHLQQALKIREPLRCTFNDINPGPVRAAVANPRKIDMKLVAAQEARRVLDRLVGYTVSPVLSRGTGQRMSAGRVQSPAVRLVVERERAIEQFKVTTHYGVVAHFDGWTAEWDTKSLYPQEPHYCLDPQVAEKVSSAKLFTVEAATDRERELNPYAPFTTSTLQQAASVRLKLTPAQTMDLAQSLYEQGVITYHRTDSPNLSADGFAAIAAYGAAKGLRIVAAQRRFKAKGDAQEAHEAVRPSHIEDESAGTTDDERALYQLIRQRALASQLPAARFAVREATLTATVLNRKVVFQARGEKLIDAGWKSVYAEDEADDTTPANPVPALKVGQTCTASRSEIVTKKTKPPKRFTEASLIKELEAQGIGRPSTYAAIMSRINSAGYVVADKKQTLSPTPLGCHLVDSLVGKLSFIELSFTRDMESQLDEIAEGRTQYLAIVGQAHATLYGELGSLTVKAPEGTPKCPTCEAPLRRSKGEHGHFWACTAYPSCKTTLPDEKGKPGARKAPAEVSAHACPSCGKGLVHRSKPGKSGFDFWGCSGYPSCKTAVPNLNGAPDFAAHAKRSSASTAAPGSRPH